MKRIDVCPKCGSNKVKGPIAFAQSDKDGPGRIFRCYRCQHELRIRTPNSSVDSVATRKLRDRQAILIWINARPADMTPIPIY